MIEVIVNKGIIEVISPYNPEFVSFAHMRGGKWSKKKEVWMFDTRDEFAVRSALMDIYGTDDYESAEKVDVRFKYNDLFEYYNDYKAIACGYEFARAKWGNIKLADHTVVIEGKLFNKANCVRAEKGTIVELRSVPKKAAERFFRENPEAVEIIGGINIGQLKEEKLKLQKRIKEIDETIEKIEDKNKRREEPGGVISDLQD
jgi:hypothetical protein